MTTDKQILQELRQCYNRFLMADERDALDQYLSEDYVSMVKAMPERIKRYAEYQLPEIALFLCASDTITKEAWAAAYKPLKALYTEKTEKVKMSDVIALLKKENHDLCLHIDERFLQKMQSVVKRTAEKENKSIEELQSEINRLTQELQQVEVLSPEDVVEKSETVVLECEKNMDSNTPVSSEENSGNVSYNAEIDESDSEDATEKKKIVASAEAKLRKHMNAYNTCERASELLQKLLSGVKGRIAEARKAAYNALPEEERILDLIIASENELPGELSEFFIVPDNANLFLRLIRNEDYSIDIISRLYRENIIDIEDNPGEDQGRNPFHAFLMSNSVIFSRYLIQHFPQSMELINQDIEYKVMFEMALDADINNAYAGFKAMHYVNLWNIVEDTELWDWILSKLEEKYHSEMEFFILPFVCQVQGRTARAFVNSLENRGIPLGRMIRFLLKNENGDAAINNELILQMTNKMEKDYTSVQRSLKRANTKVDQRAGRLFSALKNPIESLESLAINFQSGDVQLIQDMVSSQKMEPLDETGITIFQTAQHLISSQLIDIIRRMREGLSEVDVYTAEDIDIWAEQIPVTYEPLKHRYEKGENRETGLVTLNTLGFQYIERDENIVECAKVIAFEETEVKNDDMQ